jgi:hypothetical protein
VGRLERLPWTFSPDSILGDQPIGETEREFQRRLDTLLSFHGVPFAYLVRAQTPSGEVGVTLVVCRKRSRRLSAHIARVFHEMFRSDAFLDVVFKPGDPGASLSRCVPFFADFRDPGMYVAFHAQPLLRQPRACRAIRRLSVDGDHECVEARVERMQSDEAGTAASLVLVLQPRTRGERIWPPRRWHSHEVVVHDWRGYEDRLNAPDDLSSSSGILRAVAEATVYRTRRRALASLGPETG